MIQHANSTHEGMNIVPDMKEVGITMSSSRDIVLAPDATSNSLLREGWEEGRVAGASAGCKGGLDGREVGLEILFEIICSISLFVGTDVTESCRVGRAEGRLVVLFVGISEDTLDGLIG